MSKLLGCAGALLLLGGMAAAAAEPLEVAVSLTLRQERDGIFVVADTNLPDGTVAIVRVVAPAVGVNMEAGGVIAGGQGHFGPFTRNRLRTSGITVQVHFASLPALLQPPAVHAALGSDGGMMRGPLVREYLLGRFAHGHATIAK